MGLNYAWNNGKEDVPVDAVFFSPGYRTVTVRFQCEQDAKEAEVKMQLFDEGCERREQLFIMSRGTNPLLLGSFLLENEMIGQKCYNEMQKEIEEYIRDNGKGKGGR